MSEVIKIEGVEKANVSVLHVCPGDKILFSFEEVLNDLQREKLPEHLQSYFPGHDVLILDRGVRVEILRKEKGN